MTTAESSQPRLDKESFHLTVDAPLPRVRAERDGVMVIYSGTGEIAIGDDNRFDLFQGKRLALPEGTYHQIIRAEGLDGAIEYGQ